METDDVVRDILDSLGVEWRFADLPDDRDGEYQHDARLIRLRPGMTSRLHRSVLAHECAHALAGDAPAADPRVAERIERRADEQAARWLISPAAYADAERLHGPRTDAIALELDVTVDLVEAFRRVLHRERRAHRGAECGLRLPAEVGAAPTER